MKIAAAELFTYRLPLTAPLRIGGIEMRDREGLLLRVADADGVEGWGEIAPLPGYSPDSLPDALANARQNLPGLREADWPDGRQASVFESLGQLDPLPLLAPVRFGFEMAVTHLFAQAWGESPAMLFSATCRSRVESAALLAGEEEATDRQTDRALELGFHTFKLKVGDLSLTEALDRAQRVRDRLGSDHALRLDANGAWTPSDALAFCSEAEPLGIEFLEEPVLEADAWPRLIAESGIPLALDESLAGMEPGQLRHWMGLGTVVIKPSLLGGILRAFAWSEAAARIKASVVISSMYESGLAIQALGYLASSMGGMTTAAGFDTYFRFARDLGAPAPVFREGGLEVPLREVPAWRPGMSDLEKISDG